ncbi:hypothetical protein A2W39_01625 [Candidatus Azambacteria bacterium RIFCSPHIGHO2_01_46_10]|uniref:Aspartate--tRNA(Asp/Asn) ligase n=1 Tax=Candidatus Azambacteria bacterium RIFCSPHIGHO2_01_46_10 TaxID=1797293 RepID=A0A1F5BWS1_9BACT|nr:MAG: hypothetical protein A2W39_01625 [Candidatus Azambacteria bacterium RIFCSPHIGHO2_01_46_10]
MERIYSSETIKFIGQKVKLAGWVEVRRDHGKLIFIDMRDRAGIVQLVFIPKDKELHQTADSLRSEWVIEVVGSVNQRPKGMENPNVETGSVEVLVENLVILNESKTPPFEIVAAETQVGEEARLRYRYIDLRRAKMAKNLKERHRIVKFMRDFMDTRDFWEIETPFLTKGTPEGAREFAIPSRLHRGKFYVLPQSPQQFKQLLMVSGVEKYFQVARCFRDEDSRGDRQPEFTQLDIEMSFVDDGDVMDLVESMMVELVKKVFPDKKITNSPFPRIDYDEVMKKYNSDKPDLRGNKDDPAELSFLWVINMPLLEYSETEKKLVSSHHPFTAPSEALAEEGKPQDLGTIKAKAYDLVLNGYEIGGGSIRIHKRDLQNKIFEILGLGAKEIESRFGHMLRAFEYGAPPHGGIALGLDRLMMILMNESSIREVIAFPKTGDDRDLLMGAPTEVSEKQLKELHISAVKPKK